MRLVRNSLTLWGVLCVATLGTPSHVRADDTVVGTGSAASCTEAALDAAVARLVPGDTFPGGVITFNCGANPLTIAITTQKNVGFGSGTTLDGGGKITLDGGNATRHFFITGAESQVQLRDLVLIGGSAGAGNGGSIYVGPGVGLTLERVLLRDNRAGFAGGAILTEAGSALALTGSTVGSNDAPNGGGIAANGNVSLTDSLIFNNTAEVNEGGGLQVYFATTTMLRTRFENNAAANGGGFLQRGGTATITDSSFSDNVASADGGGIHVYDSGVLTLGNPVIGRNFADRGGGVFVGNTDSPVTNSSAVVAAGRLESNQAVEGGGVYARGRELGNSTPALTVQGTVVKANIATRGGGFYVRGRWIGTSFSLRENQAAQGGGAYLVGLTELRDALVVGNAASDSGGGLFAADQSMSMSRLTFDSNRALTGGAIAATTGVLAIGQALVFTRNSAVNAGGALHVHATLASAFLLDNSTFSRNAVTSGSGVGGDAYVGSIGTVVFPVRASLWLKQLTLIDGVASNGSTFFVDNGGEIEIANSIVWPLVGAACGLRPPAPPALAARFVSNNGNVTKPGTCAALNGNNDITVTDFAALRLGPLADYGGGTMSFLPANASPVLDRSPCPNSISTDQRDLLRPIDGNGDGIALCDAGAVERQLMESGPASSIFGNGFEGL